MRAVYIFSLISSALMTIKILLLFASMSTVRSNLVIMHHIESQLGININTQFPFNRAPSCLHNFAEVEVSNLNDKEPITIYSIHIQRDDSNDHTTSSTKGDNSSAHHDHDTKSTTSGSSIIHTASSRTITLNKVLEPRQSFPFSISFIPQIPQTTPPPTITNSATTTTTDSPNTIHHPYHHQQQATELNTLHDLTFSREGAADLAKLVGKDFVDIKLTNYKHIIPTSLIIQSSKGEIKAPLTYSKTRANPYHLPHSIIFYKNGFVSSLDSPYANQPSTFFYNPKTDIHSQRAFEFDLYIDNPSDEHLRIHEIFTVPPPSPPPPTTTTTSTNRKISLLNSIHIQYHHADGYPTLRFNNCGPDSAEVFHCNRATSLASSGPLVLVGNSRKKFVATIVLQDKLSSPLILSDYNDLMMDQNNSNPTNGDGNGMIDLGYLHIRFDNKHTAMIQILFDGNDEKDMDGDNRDSYDDDNDYNESKEEQVLNTVTSDSVSQNDTIHPADSKNHTVVTLFGGNTNVDINDSSSKRTDYSHSKKGNQSNNGTSPDSKVCDPLSALHIKRKDKSSWMQQYPVITGQDSLNTHDERFKTTKTTSKQSTTTTTSVHTATPSFFDFGLLSASGLSRTVRSHITNRGTVPMRIIHSMVTMEIAPDLSTQGLDYNQNALFVSSSSSSSIIDSPLGTQFNNSDSALESWLKVNKTEIIEPGKTSESPIVFKISSKPTLPNVNHGLPLLYRGSVVIRMADSNLSYSRWKEEILHDLVKAKANEIVVPFTVKILNGHIEFDVLDTYFPLYQSMYPILTSSSSDIENTLCMSSFERVIRVRNSFPLPLRLKSIQIKGGERNGSNLKNYATLDNFCFEAFQIVDFEGSYGNTQYSSFSKAKSGETWGGITLRYAYTNHLWEDAYFNIEKGHCILVLETDLAGVFHLPLSIFSGDVDMFSQRLTKSDDSKYQGMKDISTMIGNVLVKSLSDLKNKPFHDLTNYTQSKSNSNENSGWINDLKHLLEFPVNARNRSFVPIVLYQGSIASNNIESSSIYVTNRNPIPVQLSADIQQVEGMEIRLYRSSTDLKSYIHPNSEDKTNHWLSKVFAKYFSSDLKFRDDIILSPSAWVGLHPLYHQNAIISMHRSRENMERIQLENSLLHDNYDYFENISNGTRYEYDSTVMQLQPPGFTTSTFPPLNVTIDSHVLKSNCDSNAVISSLDLSIESSLCSTQPKGKATWVIPPGGQARLELLIRSPPRRALLGKDIVDLVTSGVTLSTNYGQTIPIIVAYRVLGGKLELFDNEEFHAKEYIDVPAVLRSPKSSSAFESTGVPLFIRSTFSDRVVFKNVVSSSTWFQIQFTPKNDIIPLIDGSLKGIAQTAIDCSDTTRRSFSFFHCAHDYLMFKTLEYESQRMSKEYDPLCMKQVPNPEKLISSTVKVLKKVMVYLDNKYESASQDGRDIVISSIDGSGRKSNMNRVTQTRNNGKIPSDAMLIMNTAISKWLELSEAGCNHITGKVDIHLETPSSDTMMDGLSLDSFTLSTSLSSPRLRSSLAIPYFFDSRDNANIYSTNGTNYLNFGTIPVSEVSKMYLPLRNPTGFQVRVRLAIDDSKANNPDSAIFVQSGKQVLNPWWTGGSYYLINNDGSLMLSSQNISLSTTNGASLSLVNPCLFSSTVFTNGCSGRRCGTTFSKEYIKASDFLSVTSIGASSSIGQVLRGRMYNAEGDESVDSSSKSNGDIPHNFRPFALAAVSSKDIIIPPFGIAEVGPIFFRPSSRKHFTGEILVENDLTGIEKVTIEGRGGIEKIIFLDNKAHEINGGDLDIRYGKPTLMFPGSCEGGEGILVKSVTVANVGDITVDFESVSLSQAYIAEGRKLKSGTLDEGYLCEVGGFRILGCYQNLYKETAPWSLHSFFVRNFDRLLLTLLSILGKDVAEGYDQSTLPNILDGFKLKPNEVKVLHFTHSPDCTFRSMYATVNLEQSYSNSQGKVVKKSHQLLLGYDLGSSSSRKCIPAWQAFRLSPSLLTKLFLWERKWAFNSRIFLELIVSVVPIIIFCYILVDIFYSAWQRRICSHHFENIILSSRVKNKTKLNHKSDSNNWASAYRCLSRADPNANELVQLSREQTRQILLGRYRKKGIMQPQCIFSNGTFCRDKHQLSSKASTENVKPENQEKDASTSHGLARRNANPGTMSLSDALFSSYCPFRESYDSSFHPIVSCGLNWREGARRGLCSSRLFTGIADDIKNKNVVVEETTYNIPKQDKIRDESKGTRRKEPDSIDIHPQSHVDGRSVNLSPKPTKSYEKSAATSQVSNGTSIMDEKCNSRLADAPIVKNISTSTLPSKNKTSSIVDRNQQNDRIIKKELKKENSNITEYSQVSIARDLAVEVKGRQPLVQENKKVIYVQSSLSSNTTDGANRNLNIANNIETKTTDTTSIQKLNADVESIIRVDLERGSIEKDNFLTEPEYVKSIDSTVHKEKTLVSSSPRPSPIIDVVQSGFTDTPPSQKRALLRPPPGLAPPPGFSIDDAFMLSSNSPQTIPSSTLNNHKIDNEFTELPSNDFGKSIVNSNDIGTSSKVFNESALSDLLDDRNTFEFGYQAESNSTPILDAVFETQMNEADQLMGDQSFNVMNILDFLHEPNQGFENNNDEDILVVPHLEDEMLYSSQNLGFNASRGIPSNPWSEAGTSRALAYGIDVPSGELGSSSDDQNPLSLSLILGQNLSSSGNYASNEKENEFDPDAFFSSLLGEG